MGRTLGELARLVGGRVLGDENIAIEAVNTLEEAGPGDISFLSNKRYTKLLADTKASAVIVAEDVCEAPTNLLQVADPYFAFRQVMVEVYGFRPRPAAGVHPLAVVAADATVGRDASICQFATVEPEAMIGDRAVLYPGSYVGAGARLGADCVLHPNVVVYDGCILGDRVVLHAGTVIGQDGFGFATHRGAHHKIPQAGIVRIGDDVEMGANCAVDRATLGETVIGAGTKFSDLVAIGHGTTIGEHCLLVAQVGIAGSVQVGRYCVLAGQAGVVGHISLGDGSTVAAQAGVASDVPPGKTVLGSPAIEIRQARKSMVAFASLSELRTKVRQLENRIKELEAGR